ncbi:MAG: anti-sigma factor antagonist [Proteobacteria bacterium]|nr:anti-sigma factor antagonist [Pseudomonadota bacterium]
MNAANIACKLAGQWGGAQALGPVLRGFRRPCNDLSRGAKVDDNCGYLAHGSIGCRESAPCLNICSFFNFDAPLCGESRLLPRRPANPTPEQEIMGFQVSQSGGVTLVEVEGQLIVGNRQELKQRVLEQLEGGDRKFVVDFSSTGYIDSSGLGVLVSLSKKIREQGGELRLSSLNEDLRTLFELTKLDTLFRITDTKEEALDGF